MKKLFLVLALCAGVSLSAENNNAFGLWLGSAHGWWGVDFKHADRNNALDIYINDFRFGDNSAVGISVGYYFLHYNVIKADASAGRFPLYWGPNVGFGWWGGGKDVGEYSGFDVGVNLAGGVSWFFPSSFKMDVSLELLSPSLGHWHEKKKQENGDWKTNNNPAFGLKGDLGLRLLFHAYVF